MAIRYCHNGCRITYCLKMPDTGQYLAFNVPDVKQKTVLTQNAMQKMTLSVTVVWLGIKETQFLCFFSKTKFSESFSFGLS